MISLLRSTAIIAMALVAGCVVTPLTAPSTTNAAAWPDLAPPRPGEVVHTVVPDRSQLLIRVDPEGPMARLGHSHVVGGSVISGVVITGERLAETRLDLRIDASALEVDRPDWRTAQGLKADLDAAAISGTRANMLGERVLHVDRHPEISIRSVAVSGPEWLPELTVRIRLRGAVREVVVPVAVEREAAIIRAVGAFDLMQSDFGIEPFSAAGGALRVSDRMRIRFRIIAHADHTPR